MASGKIHFRIVKPYLLSQLVAYFTPGQTHTTRQDVYIYAVCIILVHLCTIIYEHNYIIYVQAIGIEIKTSVSCLLYRKALKLSPTALTDVSLGNIVTLITKDIHIFVTVIFTVNDTWIAITQVAVVCYLLYSAVGIVSFVGIGILLSAIPLELYMCHWVTKLRLQTGKKTDERLHITQEVLSTMRIIKMYTWETFFTKNVSKARRNEIVKLLTEIYLKKVLTLVGVLFCKGGFYLLILACIWTGVSTDTKIIFYIISNFIYLKYWLGVIIPYGMGVAGEFMSSYKRINRALSAEELISEPVNEKPTAIPEIEFKDVSVDMEEKQILKNVSFRVNSGLTVITGAVGSGKSSLFKTILRDYAVASGLVVTQGRISYASQDPWLFPSSIKQNILFGEPLDETRYREVIKVCALIYDFDQFEKGDETILTDRGLNLSKGQQARINLARAVYRQTEIYILDDSLAALDATVQEYMFRECIQSFLKNKICILVSQTPSHIKKADNVIVMDKGKIKYNGRSNEQLLQELNIGNNIKKEINKEDNQIEKQQNSKLVDTEQDVRKAKVYGEEKKQGSVDYRVYKKYFAYGGGSFIVLLIIVMRTCTAFSLNYTEKLLTNWVDKKQFVLIIQNNISQALSNKYFNNSMLEEAIAVENYTFNLYSAFIIISIVLELLTTYIIMEFCKKSSINIHKAMVNKVMNANMSFFDSHLIGNILNRFSQDMLNIDENLCNALDYCLRSIFTIVGVIMVLTLVNFYFLIISVFITSISIYIRTLYLPAGRCLKRLEASTRSPMIGHLNATLEGLSTIRASKVQDILIKEYDNHQDLYTSAHYLSLCSNRAFGFFVDAVCSTFVVFVLVTFLFFDTNATAGDVGLSINLVISLTVAITWAIRQWCEVENNMTSLERILEYTDIKTERKDGLRVQNWPNAGAISYKNVYLSYNSNKNLVLKNLNFEVKSKEKIGIVGRTGAGKSSIISTIFRLYEVEGTILIDGINTKTLAFDFLRKYIAVIPQDPILFSGTIRTNLDPLNEYQDYQLWEALEKVRMKKSFLSLNQAVSSTSSTFSSGQKQLICISRAILRKNKIVVMDEATANMDNETDTMLHHIIRENFSDCTVFTIAHRLHSVMDCDRVMLLHKGEIKEFDRPSILLKNKNSLFYYMVKQAGLCK